MSNSQNNPTIEDFEECIRQGKFYYPAVKHYYPNTIVQCDRCLRTNLRSSIGYSDLDLCLACAQYIESNMKYPNPNPIYFR